MSIDLLTLKKARQYTAESALVVNVQDVRTGQYPPRPKARVVRWIGWSEPDPSQAHAFDEWVKVIPGIYTDFLEYELDTLPPDWTPRWGHGEWSVASSTTSAYGNKTLLVANVSELPCAISWDEADGASDVEVLMKWWTNYGLSPLRVLVRGSGEYGKQSGYLIGQMNLNEIGVQKWVDGERSEPFSRVSYTMDPRTWYVLRCRVVGGRISVKQWSWGEPEPEGWLIDGVDPSPIETGDWLGVGLNYFDHPGARLRVDFFAYNTGPDPIVVVPPL